MHPWDTSLEVLKIKILASAICIRNSTSETGDTKDSFFAKIKDVCSKQ